MVTFVPPDREKFGGMMEICFTVGVFDRPVVSVSRPDVGRRNGLCGTDYRPFAAPGAICGVIGSVWGKSCGQRSGSEIEKITFIFGNDERYNDHENSSGRVAGCTGPL